MAKPFNPGRNLYQLYRKTPPSARRGALHVVAYWQGFDGMPDKYPAGSIAHYAWRAGRDNKKKSAGRPRKGERPGRR